MGKNTTNQPKSSTLKYPDTEWLCRYVQKMYQRGDSNTAIQNFLNYQRANKEQARKAFQEMKNVDVVEVAEEEQKRTKLEVELLYVWKAIARSIFILLLFFSKLFFAAVEVYYNNPSANIFLSVVLFGLTLGLCFFFFRKTWKVASKIKLFVGVLLALVVLALEILMSDPINNIELLLNYLAIAALISFIFVELLFNSFVSGAGERRAQDRKERKKKKEEKKKEEKEEYRQLYLRRMFRDSGFTFRKRD